MGSKRRFFSAVLCVSANGGYGSVIPQSWTHFQPVRAGMLAGGGPPALPMALSAPEPGKLLKLQRREIEVKPDT